MGKVGEEESYGEAGEDEDTTTEQGTTTKVEDGGFHVA
jgi:hypothetical protein